MIFGTPFALKNTISMKRNSIRIAKENVLYSFSVETLENVQESFFIW